MADAKAPIRAVQFINLLTHTKGQWAGKPFDLRPWQEQIITPLFGTIRADGLRQFRTCYVEIPRKNGKSEIAAAVALLCLIGDQEEGAEVYSAAADRDQASLVFGVAAQMVRNNPDLNARLKIIESQKRIVDYQTASVYRAISSESRTKHGFNASAVIYDELHAAPNRDLWDVLTTSMGARSQPLTFAITTAGYDRHSICWEIHDYAEKVADGAIDDPTFLPVIYKADDDADWLDEKVWHKANPALGDFRGIEEMRVAAKRAEEIPAQQNVFRRLYLNQWTEAETRWLTREMWDRCAGDVSAEDLAGAKCFGGLDLASTEDICALVLDFPQEGGIHSALPFFWIPNESIKKRSRRDRVPYDLWRDMGILRATDGDVADYNVIRADINALAEQYQIQEIAYDRWNASQLVNDLIEDGAELIAFGQGFASMSAPSRELERILGLGLLKHGGNVVLKWMAANVVAKMDPAGNLKPDKSKSTERIDGIVALLMALARAMADEAAGPSVYEERGVIAI